MLLTGTFVRAIDDKQRVAIPKRLRDALGASAAAGLFVTPGTDGSLAIYTEDVLTALAGRLGSASPTQQEVRAFSRLFYAQAERVELDSQSRIRLPPQLVSQAGLTTEAVLLGVQDHMELWDRARWETYFGEKSASYDEIAEKAFGAPTEGK
jgi:MraZ protein